MGLVRFVIMAATVVVIVVRGGASVLVVAFLPWNTRKYMRNE